MNSTERVIEYGSMAIEDQDGAEPQHEWPSKGKLDVRDLSAGYGKLPSILKNISFTIEGG
ncbi:hypothetical protein DPV78_009196 [Talaromyces pinophilus]|nr:hypothetical protein DPV78_009196 [Talaromyces pinophilus]